MVDISIVNGIINQLITGGGTTLHLFLFIDLVLKLCDSTYFVWDVLIKTARFFFGCR